MAITNLNANDNWQGLNLIEVVDVQSYINNANTSLTSFINTCIGSVSIEFENYCQTGLKEASYTGVYDWDCSWRIYTKNIPIISLSALQYRTSFAGTWTDLYASLDNYIGINDTNIEIDSSNAIIPLLMTSQKNIKVVYSAGFATVPADLKKVAIEAVAQMIDESKYGKGQLGIANANIGTGGMSQNVSLKTIENRWYNVLDRYKKIVI